MKRFGLILLFVVAAPRCVFSDLIPIPDDMGDGFADQGGLDGMLDLPPMCSDDSVCPIGAPVCGGGGQCEGCQLGNDTACATHHPTTPVCGPSGACVRCLPGATAPESAACPSVAPICENAACRVCRAHSECASGACKPDGSCAPGGDVLYVDNNAGKGCQAAGPGTRAMPFCEVNAAALAATTTGKAYVVVAGSSTAYGAVSLSTVTQAINGLTIVGPGRSATPTARIVPSVVTNAFSLSTLGGNAATVTVDGLELTGQGAGSAGVRCNVTSGVATLTLRNSLVQMSGGAGVDANGCTLTLDRNTIGPSNTGGGVILGGTTSYTVTNNIIAGNGTGARGVTINDSATGVFAFNTIANNLVAAGSGGISCGGAGAKLIQASIVVGNTPQSGTQFFGNCTLMNVVTGADSFTGASMLSPDLDASFRLTSAAANDACCVDKVTNPTTPNASHDVDGAMRPKGTAHDIGAHEAR